LYVILKKKSSKLGLHTCRMAEGHLTIDMLWNSTEMDVLAGDSMSTEVPPSVPAPRPLALSAYIVPAIFAVIFVVGVAGNSLLIFTILRHRSMRTTPNIFIGSLALGDLLLLFISVPFYSLIYTYDHWPHGDFLCKLTAFLVTSSLGVSIFTLTALSVDRYLAIVHPMRSYTDSPTKRTVLTAALIWLVAAAFAAVEGYSRHALPFKLHGPNTTVEELVVCREFPDAWGRWYSCFRISMRFVVYFVVPISIIGVLYLLMARSLLKGASSAAATQGPAAARQAEARRKVAVLVLSMIAIFIVCWLPRHIYMLWFHCPSYGYYNMFWHIWKIGSFCLSFANSCINPVALYFLSAQFRMHFRRFFRCGRGEEDAALQRQSEIQWSTSGVAVAEVDADATTMDTLVDNRHQ
jgi:gastrin-releasing peptide receptor